jgi:hypothetical protein
MATKCCWAIQKREISLICGPRDLNNGLDRHCVKLHYIGGVFYNLALKFRVATCEFQTTASPPPAQEPTASTSDVINEVMHKLNDRGGII